MGMKKMRVVVTGHQNGLGNEIYKKFDSYVMKDVFEIRGVDHNEDPNPCLLADVTDKRACFKAVELAVSMMGGVDILINNVGVNHICPIEELEERDVDRLFRTNVYSTLFMTQACFHQLKKNKGTIVNITSNAAHMPMTDSWAYNGTKGAAEIITKQMARELTKRHDITVFGIAPNKLAGTGMSWYIDHTFPPMRGMTFDEGREYQLKGLLTGEETKPEQIANLLAYLLEDKERHKYLSGCILQTGL
jgi:NAD(P)-dependent dehydrogenase (short-subunit alcohol dehydrogenase family)